MYIDGTQSLGALRFDAARIQPDMLAVHGYKWLLSPNGAGFFYIAPQLRERLQPNVVGWRSHRDWRNVDNLHHGAPELLPSAEKYEGGSVSFALLYAMEASLDLILETGPDVIEQRVLDLASKTRDILRQLGATVARLRVSHCRGTIRAPRCVGPGASAQGTTCPGRRPARPSAGLAAPLQQRAGFGNIRSARSARILS